MFIYPTKSWLGFQAWVSSLLEKYCSNDLGQWMGGALQAGLLRKKAKNKNRKLGKICLPNLIFITDDSSYLKECLDNFKVKKINSFTFYILKCWWKWEEWLIELSVTEAWESEGP